MPTYNRRPYVKLAFGHFFWQEYPNKELIIVDDGTDSVEDLVIGLSGVRYIRLQQQPHCHWRQTKFGVPSRQG